MLLWFVSLHFNPTRALRVLRANTLVPCMDHSEITALNFNIEFTPENRSLAYDLSINVGAQGYVYAEYNIVIYGLTGIIKGVINPCSDDVLKELCPLNTGEIDIQSQVELSKGIVDSLPGIAYTMPNIDAYAIIKVRSIQDGTQLACIRIEVANDRTVSQTSVKWVTAVLSGLGLLVSAVLTYFGSSLTAQHISATSHLMFTYFQSMAIVDMEAIERVPPIASAWCENIAWSVGLVYTKFMQQVFRWYVQATGGTPSTYKIYKTKPVITQRLRRRAEESLNSVVKFGSNYLPARIAEYAGFQSLHNHSPLLTDHSVNPSNATLVTGLAKRSNPLAEEVYVKSSDSLVVYRGIKRFAFDMGIEDTAAVLTSLTMFVFVCICVAVLFFFVYLFFMFMKRRDAEKHYRSRSFAPLLPAVLKGTLLKLLYMAFPSLMIFCMWEWVQSDSAGVIVASVFVFLLAWIVIGINVIRVLIIGRRSIRETGTPAYLLYSHAPTIHKYGFLYVQYDAKYYYFVVVALGYHFVKALFIAFAQSSGKTQGLALFIIELMYLALTSWRRPYMSKSVNIVNIVQQVFITLNAMFYLFYSNLMTQPLAVNGIMGIVQFVLNAIFSLVLLIYIIVFCLLCLIHKNPDSHRARTKDDRLSFIDDKPMMHNAAVELTALGAAAAADHDTEHLSQWLDPGQPVDPFDNKSVCKGAAVYEDANNTTLSLGSQRVAPTYESLPLDRVSSADSQSTVNASSDKQEHGFLEKFHWKKA